MCKYAYLQDNFIMFIVDNPDYKDGSCPYSMKLNTSSIQMSEFDKDNSLTIDGELLFYNHIVIPDTEIFLHLSYPLNKPKNIRITSDDPYGFSLTNLIHKIKNVYEWVYKKEEETALIKTFTLLDYCNRCNKVNNEGSNEENNEDNNENNNENELKDYINENNEDIKLCSICSICLEYVDKESKITECNHIFHKNCIYQWINTNKNTCPLCRKELFSCSCQNGFIISTYTGKVIPKEKRGILSRNNTDGIFGIYGYDFEELFLEEMIYNRKTKILYPKVFS
jgi:hypothetical protein